MRGVQDCTWRTEIGARVAAGTAGTRATALAPGLLGAGMRAAAWRVVGVLVLVLCPPVRADAAGSGACVSDRVAHGVAVCGEALPPRLARLAARAGRLALRSDSGPSPRRAQRLLARVLRRIGRSSAAAASRGTIPPPCAAALGTLAGCLGPPPDVPSCLAGPGPLTPIEGTWSERYRGLGLPPAARLDARGATFLAGPANPYPIVLTGGPGVCMAGATILGAYERTLGWAEMHAANNAAIAFTGDDYTLEAVRIDNVTDGIRPEGGGRFTIRGAWLSYVRDDCVENDHLQGGLIEDSLFDGCYVGISERPTSSILAAGADGRGQLLTVRRSLIRLHAMPGPRNGAPTDLGLGKFFKWSERGTGLALHDNVLLAEQLGQDGPSSMELPEALGECSNNVMVWLGAGEFPAPLPVCFTLTRDRAVWEQAVAAWKGRHPELVGR
jgi:hypothetical protein